MNNWIHQPAEIFVTPIWNSLSLNLCGLCCWLCSGKKNYASWTLPPHLVWCSVHNGNQKQKMNLREVYYLFCGMSQSVVCSPDLCCSIYHVFSASFFFNTCILFSSNRQVNHEKELTLADVMSENITKDPVDLGVPHRLCLEDQVLYICEWIS